MENKKEFTDTATDQSKTIKKNIIKTKQNNKKGFFSTITYYLAGAIEVVAPFGLLGIDLLGMKEILNAAAIAAILSSILLAFGVSAAAIPVIFVVTAAVIGFVAAIENWALSVQATKAMLKHYTGPVLDKSFTEYKQDIKNAKGFWATCKVIFKPLVWKILPDFIWKLIFLYKNHRKAKLNITKKPKLKNQRITWWQVWKARVKNEAWLASILKPFIRILGPVAAGAAYVMGLMGIFYLFPSIFNITAVAFGIQIPILVSIACTAMFIIAAVQNRSLEVNRSLYRMHGGFKRLQLAAKTIYAAEDLLVLTPKEGINTAEHIFPIEKKQDKQNELENKAAVNNNNSNKQLQTDEHYIQACIPTLNKNSDQQQITGIFADHLKWQQQENNHLYEINKTSIEVSKLAQQRLQNQEAIIKKLHWQVTPQVIKNHYKININLKAFNISNELTLEDGAIVILRKKKFLERWLPGILGPILMLFGPIVSAGTAMLGMVLILNLVMPQQFILSMVLGATIGLVAAIQNFCLEGEESINLLRHTGRSLDDYYHNIKKAKTLKEKFNAIFPNGFWFLIPDVFLKIGVNIYLRINNYKNIKPEQLPEIVKRMQKKGWLLVTIGSLVGIGGPLAHGAEAYRAILLGIFASLGFAGAIAFPPWVIAIATIGFVVCMIQNRALEVKETYEKLDELDKELEAFVKNHKLAFIGTISCGLIIGTMLPITLMLTGVLQIGTLATVGLTLLSALTFTLIAGKVVYYICNKKTNSVDKSTELQQIEAPTKKTSNQQQLTAKLENSEENLNQVKIKKVNTKFIPKFDSIKTKGIVSHNSENSELGNTLNLNSLATTPIDSPDLKTQN